MQEPIIQVAGVMDALEADLLMEAGVRYLGFPLRLTVNKEDLTEMEAAQLIHSLPDEVNGVLITYLSTATETLDFCRELGVRVVQLHGPIPTEELADIKRRNSRLQVFKSLVVREGNEEDLRRLVEETAPWVDAYITDTFNPTTGQEGATGLTHDWSISRRLVEWSPRPVILAGGLTAENVAEAIRIVRPAGVDAHTGVEGPDGRKEATKVQNFVASARAAFAAIHT
ncbi:MAG: phosphoribosylanthranilate isomerase [Verrucomicrobiota bacterium]|jgi:phosphoribosylanthranilate isomerase|nr:phosphoribosylanthranilate isomerase [Verrucomicrobiota bacterium]